MPSESPNLNTLCYFRPFTVAYVRRTGPIVSTVTQSWMALRSLLSVHGLQVGGALPSYGVIHGKATDPDCAYDACIELPPGLEQRFNGAVGTQTVPGGVYISSERFASHKRLASAFDRIAEDP